MGEFTAPRIKRAAYADQYQQIRLSEFPRDHLRNALFLAVALARGAFVSAEVELVRRCRPEPSHFVENAMQVEGYSVAKLFRGAGSCAALRSR